MTIRKPLPRRLEKAIYQEFGSTCPFCDETDVSALQIHHIEAYANVQTHEAENLILTCANCHQKIEAGDISTGLVYRAKIAAEKRVKKPRQKPKNGKGTKITVTGDNLGMIAENISIRGSKTKITQLPPQGTIAADLALRNHAKYLIDRYHEFKKIDVGKGKVNFAIFYQSIEREFGAKWDYISRERFESLVAFLHRRIDQTRFGKAQKSRGIRRYSSFTEHGAK
ncbi:HNH endonuclease signature motif containing protein [Roseobacter litoralis]|uniref:HNH endonuclease signature motif containing protein n=1 Tax=Roseobacter litoralis TaxID=42443 RepID=UPI0024920187|nr:HNH endonuclease signature motif containing protein [Roseobacter litoralis]